MRLPLALLVVSWFGVAAESYPPAEVTILGDIDYAGKTADLQCSSKPRYCALVFNGKSGDVVEVRVSGASGKPFVAFADGSLKELARGAGVATVTLPDVADSLATYYIIFRDPEGKGGRFSVELRKK